MSLNMVCHCLPPYSNPFLSSSLTMSNPVLVKMERVGGVTRGSVSKLPKSGSTRAERLIVCMALGELNKLKGQIWAILREKDGESMSLGVPGCPILRTWMEKRQFQPVRRPLQPLAARRR